MLFFCFVFVFFGLTGDGVCIKNAMDNGWLVFRTDGDGLVARIRPQECSF